IADALNLDGEDRTRLIQAADESRAAITVETKNPIGRRIAAKLARHADSMSPADLAAIYAQFASYKGGALDYSRLTELQARFGSTIHPRKARALVDYFAFPRSARKIQEKANAARRAGGLSLSDPVDPVLFLEQTIPQIFD